jgi:hypothetical protein
MDTRTLLAHRPFWGIERTPRTDPLPELTDEEQRAYAALRSGRHGRSLRLEQEFARFGLVEAALST